MMPVPLVRRSDSLTLAVRKGVTWYGWALRRGRAAARGCEILRRLRMTRVWAGLHVGCGLVGEVIRGTWGARRHVAASRRVTIRATWPPCAVLGDDVGHVA